MSHDHTATDPRDNWWEALGLSVDPGTSANQHRRVAARVEVLRRHRPAVFEETTASETPRHATLADVQTAISTAQTDVDHAIAAEAARRSERGWSEIRAAYDSPDADTPVTTGDWAGFTRAGATAWCWNLYQYEPHGLIAPGAILRSQRLQQLGAGELPDGFGYAARARQLEGQGLTPSTYRAAREALGAPTYTSQDVQMRRP